MDTDKWSTWLGLALAVLYAFQQNVAAVTDGQPINWLSVVVAAMLAGLGYLVNKPKG